MAAGSTQTISYSAGFTSKVYSEHFRIYVDWNQDSDLADVGENIATATAATNACTLTSNFTVPTTARNGKTRMRVVMSYASSTNSASSCGTYSYGKTEDYSITVTGGTTTPTLDGSGGIALTAEATAELSLYPNPAADQLHLNSVAELQSIEVLDVRGAKASVRYLGSGDESLSGLAPGLLYASDGQNTFVKRFAKQ